MSLDFAVYMNKLVSKYGRPISYDTERDLFNYYNNEALTSAGNDIPYETIIGKTATGAYVTGETIITVDVSVLNESSGLMPEYESGTLIGSIGITAVKYVSEEETIAKTGTGMDFSLYSNGTELVYADFTGDEPALETIHESLGSPAIRLQSISHGNELYRGDTPTLNNDQQSKLTAFVVGAFRELS